ncbi:GntR family transcriptional regulator [Peptacetobacter hominis]|uniref:GntR family transcriptional regulator n=1 Tax=Peptacetobacter hominis TaxID=2743610 RepID=A0A544QWA7_9FIRM|nr:GntR family transcriptional regulator [Peptacetobacter hominis]TQQ84979.1 GntR family transcriptional regulator [Peptacetobacter hominis]
MKFTLNGDEPIFLQIAKAIEDEIICNRISEGEQVPSTTEISKRYSINPATVLKGMNLLVDRNILYKRRGLGMFVQEGAVEIIRKDRKEQFINEKIGNLLDEAEKIGITRDELIELIQKYKG